MKIAFSLVPGAMLFIGSNFAYAQEATEGYYPVSPKPPVSQPQVIPRASTEREITADNYLEEEAEESSTVIYKADFFTQYAPITASDMLQRIPGINIFNRRQRDGNRGLGTGGNLLINGQRIAGKDNSALDQLDRITAAEVKRIEIIRDTTGALNVRGAGEVINVILIEVPSRSSTTVQAVNRLNHDDTFEFGGSVAWSLQMGNFQSLVNVGSEPNYENRDRRENRISSEGDLLGTLFETNIRDQDIHTFSNNMSYSAGSHRIQLNALVSDGSFERPILRNFVDFIDGNPKEIFQEELVDNTESNWEIGGDYEYSFDDGSRLAILFLVNDEIRDFVRERFQADPATDPLNKNLYIDSQRENKEFIVQANYNFSLSNSQSLRVGAERAVNQLDSKLFIASPSDNSPGMEQFGGLALVESVSNPGTHVEEVRFEGFAFHNWAITGKASLESSVVYEMSEIAQSGVVSKTRDFQFWRPSFDFRYNFADNIRFRGTIKREVSQLSFSSFAATTNEEDRDIDALSGNPELEPETSWRYEGGLEYRLPNDTGVLSTSLFYNDVDNRIGRINATVDPNQPLSATGNVGPAKQYGWWSRASIRLDAFNLTNAIISGRVGLFDSEILDPFINQKVRTWGRGFGNIDFRQDITDLGLSYGIEYNHPLWGGFYDNDILTRTRNDRQRSLDLFVQKVMWNDWTFRLETDNTLDASECRYRERYAGTTINGDIDLIQNSCSSRYRRWIFTTQTTF